jgi:hypothetical protein
MPNAPSSVMMMEMTAARTGRRMKKYLISAPPFGGVALSLSGSRPPQPA